MRVHSQLAVARQSDKWFIKHTDNDQIGYEIAYWQNPRSFFQE